MWDCRSPVGLKTKHIHSSRCCHILRCQESTIDFLIARQGTDRLHPGALRNLSRPSRLNISMVLCSRVAKTGRLLDKRRNVHINGLANAVDDQTRSGALSEQAEPAISVSEREIALSRSANLLRMRACPLHPLYDPTRRSNVGASSAECAPKRRKSD
eukprot:4151628-Pyramimonas_sp.AAC.1